MILPNPDQLFDRLGPYLPEVPIWAWRTAAGTALLAATISIALHQPRLGGGLLLVGALAAMFLMFALSVLTVLGRGHVSVVTWLVAAAFLIACIFPDHFSLLAYTIGVIAFIAAGQGVAREWT